MAEPEPAGNLYGEVRPERPVGFGVLNSQRPPSPVSCVKSRNFDYAGRLALSPILGVEKVVRIEEYRLKIIKAGA